MNKPILAAALGVTFGLFLGALFLGGRMHRSCPRMAVRTVEIQRPVVMRTPCGHAYYEEQQTAPETPALDMNNADAVLSAAQTSYVQGDYAQAVSLARSAEKMSPVRAWRIIGAAACIQKDAKLAEQAYRRLDAAGRQYLVYVCQRQGITAVGGRHFRSFQID